METTELLNSAVTLAVGLVAFVIYYLNKRSNKRNAALIILNSMQDTERKLKQVKESLKDKKLPANLRFDQAITWEQNKYLLVSELDRDEWDETNSLFEKSLLIDSLIRKADNAFWDEIEAIRQNKQRVLADTVKASLDSAIEDGTPTPTEQELQDKLLQFGTVLNRFYENSTAIYIPKALAEDTKVIIESINLQLSLSSVGTKLKKQKKTWKF